MGPRDYHVDSGAIRDRPPVLSQDRDLGRAVVRHDDTGLILTGAGPEPQRLTHVEIIDAGRERVQGGGIEAAALEQAFVHRREVRSSFDGIGRSGGRYLLPGPIDRGHARGAIVLHDEPCLPRPWAIVDDQEGRVVGAVDGRGVRSKLQLVHAVAVALSSALVDDVPSCHSDDVVHLGPTGRSILIAVASSVVHVSEVGGS